MERTVLTTGAGSGIGALVAVEAARLGFTSVAAVHRTAQAAPVHEAAAVAGVEVTTEVLDVTDDRAAGDLVERVSPWALVNNAGVMNAGLLEDVPVEDARRQLDVMVLAPVRLTQLALPGMRRRGGGRIVNVSSPAGEMSVPFQSWYDAAKRALSALSDGMRAELVRHGIDVVVVEPGAYDTPLWRKARAELDARRRQSVSPESYDRAMAVVDEITAHAGDPAEVARVVGEVLHAGHPRYRYRVGPGASLFPATARLLPTSARDRVTRALGGLR